MTLILSNPYGPHSSPAGFFASRRVWGRSSEVYDLSIINSNAAQRQVGPGKALCSTTRSAPCLSQLHAGLQARWERRMVNRRFAPRVDGRASVELAGQSLELVELPRARARGRASSSCQGQSLELVDQPRARGAEPRARGAEPRARGGRQSLELVEMKVRERKTNGCFKRD